MKEIQLKLCLFSLLISSVVCDAKPYQISGTVVDENGQPADAIMYAVPTNSPTQGGLPVTISNGTYSATLDVPQGTVMSIIAMRGYHWMRTIKLGANSTVTNFNFILPTVNTSVVSVTGRITVGGSPPQTHATVALRKIQLVNGQELQAATVLKVPGLTGGTNGFRFYDLPAGNYEMWGQADSQSWTQIVISVASTNIPVLVNIDY